jgi:hypothetical protein
MKRLPRHAPLPLLALLAAVGLSACGGGGASPGSSPAGSAQAAAPKTSATTPSATTAPGRAPRPSRPSNPSGAGAGGAASFHIRGGDNSIPNYGEEAATVQRNRAAAALGAYLRARARAQWGRACGYLSAATRRSLEQFAAASKQRQGCAAAIAALSGGGPTSARANPLRGGLVSLRVKGTRAFALFYGPHNQRYDMPMAREGGAWKVTQLAPFAYPPSSAPPG